MTRAEQKDKRRKEILAAGLDLFIRNGVAATKVQDIADAVGMSVGLLFHYFESKEKLYEELIKIGISGPQSTFSNVEVEPIVFFETAARDIFSFLKTDPFVAKMFVLMNQAERYSAASESVKTMINDLDFIVSKSVEKIEQGQRDGTIKDGNPIALTIAFWGAISGVAEEVALDKDVPIPDSDWIVDILRAKNI